MENKKYIVRGIFCALSDVSTFEKAKKFAPGLTGEEYEGIVGKEYIKEQKVIADRRAAKIEKQATAEKQAKK